MRHFLCYSVLLLCTLSACHKRPGPYTPLNEDLKNNFGFKPGTYWVYRDSLTGNMDSFFVSRYNYSNHNTEGINIALNNLDLSAAGFYMEKNILLFQFHVDRKILGNYPHNPNSIIYAPLFHYPPVPGYFRSEHDTGNVTGVNTTLTINQNTFNNVFVVNHYKYANEPGLNYSCNDWFYINNDVGIIKVKLFRQADGLKRIWELQRWHIVK